MPVGFRPVDADQLRTLKLRCRKGAVCNLHQTQIRSPEHTLSKVTFLKNRFPQRTVDECATVKRHAANLTVRRG